MTSSNDNLNNSVQEQQAVNNPLSKHQSNASHQKRFAEYYGVEPKRVPASHGWRWISAAWGLFVANIPMWLINILAWFVIYAALQILPVLGWIASGLLYSVFIAGFLYCAHQQKFMADFEFTDLFEGFRYRMQPLVGLSFLILLANITVIVITACLMLGALFFEADFDTLNLDDLESVAYELFNGPLVKLLLVLVFSLLLFTLLMVFTFFAPHLIFCCDLGIFEALKLSAKAFQRNILALTVYGFAALGILLLSIIPLGLGLFLSIPVLLISYCTVFQDIFGHTTALGSDGDIMPNG